MRNAYFHGAILPITNGIVEVGSEFEAEEVEQARLLFDATDRVLVAGGGMGWLALHIAARCPFVLIVEPLPYLYRLLVDNLHVDGVTIHVIKGAIGATRRQADFYVDDLWALSRFAGEGEGASFYTEVYDLASLVAQAKLTGLALDVEGAEYEILLSLPAPLAPQLRRLLIEFHLFRLPPGAMDEIVGHLLSIGYRVTGRQDHRRNPRDPQSPDAPHVVVQSFVWGGADA